MTTTCLQSFTKLEQGKTLLITGSKGTGKTTIATTLAIFGKFERIIVIGDKKWKTENVILYEVWNNISLKLSPSHFSNKEKTIVIMDVGFDIDTPSIEYYLNISKCYGVSFIYITEYTYMNWLKFDYIAFAQTYSPSIITNFHKHYIGKALDLYDFQQIMHSITNFEFIIVDNEGVAYWIESVPEDLRVQRRCRCFRDELIAFVALRVPPVVSV